MVTAAPAAVPQALKAQLGEGGRMVIPVGTDFQDLVLVRRAGGRFTEERLLGVRFVPLV
jgi:protein-L-isoaspartate(D-aspartate) O-methyltransferase